MHDLFLKFFKALHHDSSRAWASRVVGRDKLWRRHGLINRSVHQPRPQHVRPRQSPLAPHLHGPPKFKYTPTPRYNQTPTLTCSATAYLILFIAERCRHLSHPRRPSIVDRLRVSVNHFCPTAAPIQHPQPRSGCSPVSAPTFLRAHTHARGHHHFGHLTTPTTVPEPRRHLCRRTTTRSSTHVHASLKTIGSRRRVLRHPPILPTHPRCLCTTTAPEQEQHATLW